MAETKWQVNDPPLREDGRCAICEKPRAIPKSSYARGEIALDPFCSSACCRVHYGIELEAGIAERSGSLKGRPTKGIWKDEGWDEVAA